MYEYRCKLVKVVDGDTVDVDIDLGFDVWLKKQRQKKRKPFSLQARPAGPLIPSKW